MIVPRMVQDRTCKIIGFAQATKEIAHLSGERTIALIVTLADWDRNLTPHDLVGGRCLDEVSEPQYQQLKSLKHLELC
ncbi:hypothetical protein [uncultured Ruegeria sp.]|uniref:hypothetical protein n=1 Tax=uncultured Ruegeria sp. TaxID=259304 RepID=UPI00262B9C30|nr:hypothetical protein [uncultured Ruegeria sp.]